MKYILLLLFPFCALFAEAARYELLENGFPLIYYMETPKNVESYPLLLLVDDLPRLDELKNKQILQELDTSPLWMGRLQLMPRGMDPVRGNNEKDFRLFTTPTQILKDHVFLVHHLRSHPPAGWNGQIIIGGGCLAIKLAHAINATACITNTVWGDLSFRDSVWELYQKSYNSYWWPKRKFLDWRNGDIDHQQALYDEMYHKLKADPDPFKDLEGMTFQFWADLMDQTIDKEFLSLKCPILCVVPKDYPWDSIDRLVDKAKHNHQDVTYIKYDVKKDVDPLAEAFLEFIQTKVVKPSAL